MRPVDIEDIKYSLSAPNSCSKDTVYGLRYLLGLDEDDVSEKEAIAQSGFCSGKNARSTDRAKTSKQSTKRSTKVTSVAAKGVASIEIGETSPSKLSHQAKIALATTVVNNSLKVLVEPAIVPPPNAIKNAPKTGLSLASGASQASRTGKRGSPTEATILVDRSLNQLGRTPRLPPASTTASNSLLRRVSLVHVAQCCSSAFEALRSVEKSDAKHNYKLENAVLAFVSKLITLDLYDLALGELSSLRSRLNTTSSISESSIQHPKITKVDPEPGIVASLLDIKCFTSHCSDFYELLISYQVVVLRLVLLQPHPMAVSAILPSLEPQQTSSPVQVLMQCHKFPELRERTIRNTGLLLQLLSSLATKLIGPTIKDATDTKSRLSLKLQTLVIRTKAVCMKTFDTDDVSALVSWAGFRSCLESYARTTKPHPERWSTARDACEALRSTLAEQSSCEGYVTGEVCATLSQIAADQGLTQDAIAWSRRSLDCIDRERSSKLTLCAWSTRLAALSLQNEVHASTTDDLQVALNQALEALNGSLSGTFEEFNAALHATTALRKAVVVFVKSQKMSSKQMEDSLVSLDTTCHKVLCAYVRFLVKFLGSNPGTESDSERFRAYHKRRDLVSDLARPAVESVLYSIQRQQVPQAIYPTFLSRALGDCTNLVARLNADRISGCEAGAIEVEIHERLMLLISDTYWSFYTTHNDKPRRKTALASLKDSCNVLQGLSKHAKKSGRLSHKLYKLGRVFQSLDEPAEAQQAFDDSMQTMIEEGLLDREVMSTSVMIPLTTRTSEDCRVFKSALKASIDMRTGASNLQRDTSVLESHTQLSELHRATLLEWQLELLNAQSKDSHYCAAEVYHVGSSLLGIYEPSHFPLRHRRILSKLLATRFDLHTASNQATLLERVQVLNSDVPLDDLANDHQLANHKSHIRASLHACVGLRVPEAAASHFEKAISIWKDLTERFSEDSSARDCIDDIEVWTSQVDAIAGYFGVQRLDTLRLGALFIQAEAYQVRDGNRSASFATSHLLISAQYMRLGYPEKAEKCLAHVKSWSSKDSVGRLFDIQLQIATLDYHLAIGNLAKCETCFSRLKAHIDAAGSKGQTTGLDLTFDSASDWSIIVAEALQACARLRHESGSAYETLILAKKALSLLQQSWKALQKQSIAKNEDPSNNTRFDPAIINALAHQVSNMAIAEEGKEVADDSGKPCMRGPLYWSLARKLFASMLLVSRLSKHYGLFQDAILAAEQAYKLGKASASDSMIAEALVEMAESSSRAGQADVGAEHFRDASSIYNGLGRCKEHAFHHRSFGYHNHIQSQWMMEMQAYEHAEDILVPMVSPTFVERMPDNLFERPAGDQRSLALESPASTTATRDTQLAVSRRRKGVRAMPEETIIAHLPRKGTREDTSELLDLAHDITRRKADSLLSQGKLDDAARLLRSLHGKSGTIEGRTLAKTTFAIQLLLQALELMQQDTVFNMLSESTISYPAIASCNGRRTPQHELDSLPSVTPKSKKTRGVPGKRARARSLSQEKFVQQLLLAFENSSDLASHLARQFSNALASRMSASATISAMILSLVQPDSSKRLLHPAAIAYSIDIVRSLAVSREQDMTKVNNAVSQSMSVSDWPMNPCDDSVNVPSLHDYQADLINVLPTEWLVVSLTLSDDHNYLYINRYQTSQSPFTVRIPISRQQTDESSEESLTFAEARTELYGIIRSSDDTIQLGRDGDIDMKAKSSKSQWWAEREALDSRLKDLLTNMETMWLGGFRGILSPHAVSLPLLARFQQSFMNILEKHLPSRQGQHRKTAANRVELNTKVFELFVGLGAPSDQKNDPEEALTDLLYFVMDILQFRGEANAYDEIDFDAIIVETQDALQSYHDTVAREFPIQDFLHTILILDKKLHAFPWESMPCLEGRSVSRLPSLIDLRDRVLLMRQQKRDSPESQANGVTVPRQNGSYFLNPSEDLPKTQARFSGPLSTLTKSSSWTSITGRAPTETEFGTALRLQSSTSPTTSEDDTAPNSEPYDPHTQRILLYFGHGSGSHYIRPKRIKRLRPTGCAVTLLFGCSSVALKEAGEFEPYGVPKTYLVAGAPAVLGALWDVTDGDVDAFAAGVLWRWGLLGRQEVVDIGGKGGGRRGGKRKGIGVREVKINEKEREKMLRDEEAENVCLSEAVAVARGECYLKYLNGAALVVYGVPVYLEG